MLMLSPLRSLCAVLLTLAVISTSAAAPASETDAATLAFSHLQIILTDVPPPDGLPLANTRWRIVRGADELAALSTANVLARGITNTRGEAVLSTTVRVDLAKAWRDAPGPMWLIHDSQAYQFVLQTQDGSAKFTFISAGDLRRAAEATRREAEQAALSQPLDPQRFVQVGFDADAARGEFEEWLQRFKEDIDDFRARHRADRQWGKTLLADESGDALKQVFGRSIADGKKGLSLRATLIESVYSTDRRVSAPGTLVAQLLLAPGTRPVGNGGTFDDDGQKVELWYVVFDDVQGWTQRDWKESLIFKAFRTPRLPAYQVTERNVWPALAFIRGPDGKLRMFAVTRELSSILSTIFNAQIG